MRYLQRILGIASIVSGSVILIACVAWASSIPTPKPNGPGGWLIPVPHASASIGVGPFSVELSPTQVVLLAFAAFGFLTVMGILLIRYESPPRES
jgi:hypothetical protein